MPAVNRITMIVLSAQCLLLLSACKTAQPAKGPAAMPIVPVSVARATQESVPTELRVVGTVKASAIVQIKSQISGQLLRVSFTEGQNVAQGDLLFEIDSRPYEEALRQAEANVARDRATIIQMEATLARDAAQAKFNQSDAERYASTARYALPCPDAPATCWSTPETCQAGLSPIVRILTENEPRRLSPFRQ